ncbi:MAG: ribosome recycling factor [Deltaproteobacteria bacterium]|jgi:ribosome recycling factor|nr:ribosome recycling factor [Deltaproteobacteria bacterium]MBT4088205.1 ribosome recycling factor [Deltaproteobacteria bacterium]MBT4265408.1 ribosome recycling factor [Deltaproteobacteria bacterium]MBT4643660.1 ribosome recycling factor [Deltaproteobacteria bacterium]MBT6499674.1 ribosome recycling factor [Deltaproteobacteria bacterium]
MEEHLKELERKMDKAIDVLEKEFQKVRTGRANPAILDSIQVDYYGTPTQLNQVGNISVPDPQLIVITPWEKKMLSDIEKAIQKSDLGLTPQNDGNIIRLPIPPLTEDRRKDLVKQIKKLGENAKIPIRNVRREGNETFKKMEKNKEISQDDQKQNMAKVQTLTDDHIKLVDDMMVIKEKELMEV